MTGPDGGQAGKSAQGVERGDEGDPAAETLPPNRYLVLASRPCHAVHETEGYDVERDDGTGLVTLIHPKRFSRLERLFHRWLGGPRILRRPLDVYGSRIWDLCDGERSLAQIIEVMEAEYHEAIHPADLRIQRMLELMVRMGFVKLLPPEPETLRRLTREAREQAGEAEGRPEGSGPSSATLKEDVETADQGNLNEDVEAAPLEDDR